MLRNYCKQEGPVGAIIAVYLVHSVRVGAKVAAVKVFENEGTGMVDKEKSNRVAIRDCI